MEKDYKPEIIQFIQGLLRKANRNNSQCKFVYMKMLKSLKDFNDAVVCRKDLSRIKNIGQKTKKLIIEKIFCDEVCVEEDKSEMNEQILDANRARDNVKEHGKPDLNVEALNLNSEDLHTNISTKNVLGNSVSVEIKNEGKQRKIRNQNVKAHKGKKKDAKNNEIKKLNIDNNFVIETESNDLDGFVLSDSHVSEKENTKKYHEFNENTEHYYLTRTKEKQNDNKTKHLYSIIEEKNNKTLQIHKESMEKCHKKPLFNNSNLDESKKSETEDAHVNKNFINCKVSIDSDSKNNDYQTNRDISKNTYKSQPFTSEKNITLKHDNYEENNNYTDLLSNTSDICIVGNYNLQNKMLNSNSSTNDSNFDRNSKSNNKQTHITKFDTNKDPSKNHSSLLDEEEIESKNVESDRFIEGKAIFNLKYNENFQEIKKVINNNSKNNFSLGELKIQHKILNKDNKEKKANDDKKEIFESFLKREQIKFNDKRNNKFATKYKDLYNNENNKTKSKYQKNTCFDKVFKKDDFNVSLCTELHKKTEDSFIENDLINDHGFFDFTQKEKTNKSDHIKPEINKNSHWSVELNKIDNKNDIKSNTQKNKKLFSASVNFKKITNVNSNFNSQPTDNIKFESTKKLYHDIDRKQKIGKYRDIDYAGLLKKFKQQLFSDKNVCEQILGKDDEIDSPYIAKFPKKSYKNNETNLETSEKLKSIKNITHSFQSKSCDSDIFECKNNKFVKRENIENEITSNSKNLPKNLFLDRNSEINDLKLEITKKNKKTREKDKQNTNSKNSDNIDRTGNNIDITYFPKFKSGGYAILKVLSKEDGLTKHLICYKGNKYCSSELNSNERNSAWNSIKTLINKGLVLNEDKRYFLTSQGKKTCEIVFKDESTLIEDETEVLLIIDSREIKSKKDRSFFQRSFENILVCETRNISVGDFIWVKDEYVLNYIIERKKGSDFVSSIIDGRFDDQKRRLINTGIENIFYIVEGLKDKDMQKISKNYVLSCLAATKTDKIVVIETENINQTVDVIKIIDEHVKETLKRHTFIGDNNMKKIKYDMFEDKGLKNTNMRISEYFLILLCAIRGLTQEKAEEIVKKYQTINNFMQCYIKNHYFEQELASLKIGSSVLGKFLARKIIALILE
ncbi:hypothetical protein EDEG_03006 [Edhazardia aedis USNM 41457]|uniref:Crossover junction endonuclease MUS81 n=1 Tax=Edhazardia aedis (strain USNM 41457) TaxID=1003232 RepID=J9D4Z3_EDHAE|nr:hypothetical protein EDEG_03006 [Edhazardia aedis USNM 41457]|eukprot:EJW02594.1 hypothetical protein EDEG_03006 [Edhazardia aedis USNM 41457]